MKQLDKIVQELTPEEQKVYQDATEEFRKGQTYNNPKNKYMKEWLMRDYALFRIEVYRRQQKGIYRKEYSNGIRRKL